MIKRKTFLKKLVLGTVFVGVLLCGCFGQKERLKAMAAVGQSFTPTELFEKGIETTGIRTSMPSTGTVRPLILAVEFQDKPFRENIEQRLEKNFFGDETTWANDNTQDSLKEYYLQSSFGKLTIEGNTEDIFTYTSPYERSYYEEVSLDPMIEEAIASFKEQVVAEAGVSDSEAEAFLNEYLKRYDVNEDGTLDAVYIYYTGGAEHPDSRWWSYVGYFNGFEVTDAYSFGSTCVLGHDEVATVIHETGHMLGLEDYYASVMDSPMNGIAAMDPMKGNMGDHNPFSKMLLGWIEPENVTVITGGMGNYALSESSVKGECVIIVPEYDEEKGLYTEFFLITYREFTGNNRIVENVPEGGLCVYHVNATLDESGTQFLYDTYTADAEGKIPLIRQLHQDGAESHVSAGTDYLDGGNFPWPEKNTSYFEEDICFYHEGDELSPYTFSSSGMYSGDNRVDGKKYSGVTLKNIFIGDGIAEFDAGFEDTKRTDYMVSYTQESPSGSVDAIEEFQVDLYFSGEVMLSEGENAAWYTQLADGARMYDENGTCIGSLWVKISKFSDREIYILDSDNECKSVMEYGRNYTIVIPEGIFTDSLGQNVPEIRIPYSTCQRFEKIEDWEIGENEESAYACIDSDGNGIVLARNLAAEEEKLIIYKLENFKIINTISSAEVQASVLKEREDLNIQGGWRVSEDAWGIVYALKDWNGYEYLIFDSAGNILVTEQILCTMMENVIADGIDTCYTYSRENRLILFSGMGYVEYTYEPDEAIEKADGLSIVDIYGARYLGNGIIALKALVSDGKMHIYVIDKTRGVLYVSGLLENFIDAARIDGEYYLIFDNCIEVLDSEFRLINRYYPDTDGDRISYIDTWGDIVFVYCTDMTYLFDRNFNRLDSLEISWVEKIQRYTDGILYLTEFSLAYGRGYHIDISSIDTVVEDENTVTLGAQVILSGENEITVTAGTTVAEFEALLECENYEWINLEGNTITGDCALAVTSDNGIATKYFYFVVNCNSHDYPENWTIVNEPSSEASGFATRACTLCGHVEEQEMKYLKVSSFALVLEDNLTMRFWVDPSYFEGVYSNPSMSFSFGGNEYRVSEYTVGNDGRYVFEFSNIAPHKLNETVAFSLRGKVNGQVFSGKTYERSVRDYCYTELGKMNSVTELGTLLVDLLNYGAASQLYVEFDTGNLANAALTETQRAWATSGSGSYENVLNTKYATIDNPTASWKSVSLYLENTITIRYKIQVESIDGVTIRFNTQGKSWTISSDKFVSAGNNQYYVDFNGLNAGELRETVYSTVYQGNTAISNTMSYSVESYVFNNQNSSDEKLSNLLVEMMKYGDAAAIYSN